MVYNYKLFSNNLEQFNYESYNTIILYFLIISNIIFYIIRYFRIKQYRKSIKYYTPENNIKDKLLAYNTQLSLRTELENRFSKYIISINN